jgi:hypothetical protein
MSFYYNPSATSFYASRILGCDEENNETIRLSYTELDRFIRWMEARPDVRRAYEKRERDQLLGSFLLDAVTDGVDCGWQNAIYVDWKPVVRPDRPLRPPNRYCNRSLELEALLVAWPTEVEYVELSAYLGLLHIQWKRSVMLRKEFEELRVPVPNEEELLLEDRVPMGPSDDEEEDPSYLSPTELADRRDGEMARQQRLAEVQVPRVDLDDEEELLWELREEIMAQGGPMIEEEREFLREYPQLPFRPPTPPTNSYFYTSVVDVRHL